MAHISFSHVALAQTIFGKPQPTIEPITPIQIQKAVEKSHAEAEAIRDKRKQLDEIADGLKLKKQEEDTGQALKELLTGHEKQMNEIAAANKPKKSYIRGNEIKLDYSAGKWMYVQTNKPVDADDLELIEYK